MLRGGVRAGQPSRLRFAFFRVRVEVRSDLGGYVWQLFMATSKESEPNMPTLLADAASKVDLWTISAPTAANAMQVAYVKHDGKPGVLQLTSKAELGSVTTPWIPQRLQGHGE